MDVRRDMSHTRTTPMRILVAEDELDIARTYRLSLEERGHKVVLTYDGEECLIGYHDALERAKSEGDPIFSSHPFHAVVLDYRMPKIDGIEVAREILAVNPRQRIIFASAYVKETLEKSVKELKQVVELMQKPFGEQALIDTIEDNQIYEELRKLDVDVEAFKMVSPPHEYIQKLLEALRTLQKGRTF